METHSLTAVLLCCSTCGLVMISDNYTAAQVRGKAHTKLSGHHRLTYAPIYPKRPRLDQGEELLDFILHED